MKHYIEVDASKELPPEDENSPGYSISVQCWFGDYWAGDYYDYDRKKWRGSDDDEAPEFWLKEVELPTEEEVKEILILSSSKQKTDLPLPPDNGDVCWEKGKDTFTRKEVAYLLYTQRAMISNDLKAFCGKDMTNEMFDILNEPRQPEW